MQENLSNNKENIGKKKKGSSEYKMSRKEMLSFLFKYATYEKWLLCLGVLITFIKVALQVACPIILAQIFNLIQNKNFSMEYIKWGSLYILAYFVMRNLEFAKSYTMDYTVGKITKKLRIDVYTYLQKVVLSYYDNIPAGSVVSRIVSDTRQVETFYRDFLVDILTPIINIIFAYAALYILDINLGILATLSVPPIILIIRYLIKKVKDPMKRQRRQLAAITASINESVQGIDVISTLNREDFRIKQLDELTEEYVDTKKNVERTQARLQWTVIASIQYITICLGIAYFGYGTLLMHWVMPLGSIYVFIKYMEMILENLQGVAYIMERMVRTGAAVDHVSEILRLPQVETIELGNIQDVRGDVEYRDVVFSYIKGEEVLRKVNIKLEAGKTIALVGRTGSGKSTIANLLFQFYTVDSGQILIDGKCIKSYPLYKLREQMGIVLQEPFLFEGTLYDNISMGNPKISKEDALEALRIIGAKSILTRFNDDVDGAVSAQGKEFSQGERQLISFARALAHDPKILILDEATSSIDTETELQIRRAIEILGKNRSMIIIAHRLSTIQHADNIYVLERGEVAEEGNHQDLINLKGIYYEMAKQQEIC